MQHPDRTQQPEIKPTKDLHILDAEKIMLSNGIPLYIISGGEQEIFSLEVIFEAGSAHEDQNLTASFVVKLLEEGSETHSSEEISETFDYYGASISKYSNKDFSGLALYSLNKYAEDTLPVFTGLIGKPKFPEDEFHTLNNKEKQSYLVKNSKVSYMAREQFFPAIFGKEHPYGKIMQPEDYDNNSLEAIKEFYGNYYKTSNCIAIISGRITDQLIARVDKHLGHIDLPGSSKPHDIIPEVVQVREQKLIRKEDALQSAIRIGRPFYNKLHEDYIPFKFVATLLGGYFGSRLMSNIREDKGYTYGIGSNLLSLKQGAYFFISTEAGVDVREKTIHEIYYELKRLREETVGEEELDLVKKYMNGSFLQSIDGPFALAHNYKNILLFGLDKSYFHRIIEDVNSMTPARVQEIANTYLQEKNLSEVIVGR